MREVIVSEDVMGNENEVFGHDRGREGRMGRDTYRD